jgi:hypothetical protein
MREALPDKHAGGRLHEQFKSDAFDGAHDIVARLAEALVQAMTDICGNGQRPTLDGSAA